MATILAASITYYDDKIAALKRWSDVDAPEYHTTISNDLTALCLPGTKKKNKWIHADGVVSVWWLGRKSDSDAGPKLSQGLEQLKKYVNPKEGSEEFQTLLLCQIKSITILEESDKPPSCFVPPTREKNQSASLHSQSSPKTPSTPKTHLKSAVSNSNMPDNSDKREEGEILATPPLPPKRRRPLAMEVGNDFALPMTTKRESALQARINELEAELAFERRKRRDCERALDDIRRECRHPFVVPAIFDAVLSVSKLTNKLQT